MLNLIAYLVLFFCLTSLTFVLYILGIKKPLSYGVKSLFNTVIFWSIINILSLFTGVYLPLSLISLGVSILCGIPGIVTLVLIKTIF